MIVLCERTTFTSSCALLPSNTRLAVIRECRSAFAAGKDLTLLVSADTPGEETKTRDPGPKLECDSVALYSTLYREVTLHLSGHVPEYIVGSHILASCARLTRLFGRIIAFVEIFIPVSVGLAQNQFCRFLNYSETEWTT